MHELQPLIQQHGLTLLFFNVLLEQLGLPIPAYPALIVAGALALQGSGVPLGEALAVAVCACLIADLIWFCAGRRFGGFMLRSVCKVSLSPDSCIRQSQSLYLRIGPRALLISRFLPGASALTTTMAGMMRTPLPRFLAYDCAGAALWAGSALMLGSIFSSAVDRVLGWLTQYASVGIAALLGAFALFIAWKLWQRANLLRRTSRIPRISVDELRARLDAGKPPLILDVRAQFDDEAIPGSIAFNIDAPLDELRGSLGDRDVVIYCACPRELSAAMLAERLNASGHARTWALSGGLDAWRAQASA
ncbi:VTT domain-containing protein [Pseudomonas sp. PDNC002]|uniref:VTT domain-containing protein n=1 Tax=Pseudomonas sp. PDNC002 TaxID=2811422 RepID=UPI00196651D3|nr:VTT domain-containing protein [Pseudomonas sp. PDNC002]QRY79087.1 VTT domain-containing protein [Pseudomonas sp. PDNC002]